VSEHPDVSVLMPTYNDEKYIPDAIESLLNQSYKKWELIIIDGSTDNTPEIVKQFNDSRIVYLREKSSGQLNALHYGSRSIRGKYVTLLHSDDQLSSSDVIEKNVSTLRDRSYDGLFCDILKMDARGKVYGTARAVNSLDLSSPAILFLRGGSNIIPDFFFVKKTAFENVFLNYITWNMPYWLEFEEDYISTLDLRKVEPWYRYRVYSENYIRSDVGKFETVNGCLRTVIEISKRLDLPLLGIQRLFVKALKTRFRPIFRPKPCSPRHLREMIRYVFDGYYDKIPENPYSRGLLGFYTNFPSDRMISLCFDETDQTFQGKDARIFFDLMQNKKLPPVVEHVLEEAVSGFGKVIISDRNYEKAKDTMKFLNLLTRIEEK
jgi:glycosyltransferase involved in cell wall biosynthesis